MAILTKQTRKLHIATCCILRKHNFLLYTRKSKVGTSKREVNINEFFYQMNLSKLLQKEEWAQFGENLPIIATTTKRILNSKNKHITFSEDQDQRTFHGLGSIYSYRSFFQNNSLRSSNFEKLYVFKVHYTDSGSVTWQWWMIAHRLAHSNPDPNIRAVHQTNIQISPSVR